MFEIGFSCAILSIRMNKESISQEPPMLTLFVDIKVAS